MKLAASMNTKISHTCTHTQHTPVKQIYSELAARHKDMVLVSVAVLTERGIWILTRFSSDNIFYFYVIYIILCKRFLGAFAKSRKAAIGFVMSVLPRHLGYHWTDFHDTRYLRIFRKSTDKIQVSLKSDKSNGYFTWRPMCLYDISLNSS